MSAGVEPIIVTEGKDIIVSWQLLKLNFHAFLRKVSRFWCIQAHNWSWQWGSWPMFHS